MFLVKDSLEIRAGVIRNLLQKYPSIALIVAATYFEWSLCRALVALSERPNKEVREALGKLYGLGMYKDFWWAEQRNVASSVRLPEVVRDWNGVTNAFDARNRLVHGRDRYTRNMARPHVEVLLSAVADIYGYARARGVDLGKRLSVRQRTTAGGPSQKRWGE